MRGAICSVIWVALLGAPTLVCAQEDCREDIDAGLAFRQAGDDEAARARFTAAVEACDTGEALAQLALAEQALGEWVAAEANLSAALSRDEPAITANRAVLEGALATIAQHLGDLDLPCSVEGATVRVGGRAVGVTPLAAPLRVEAGPVVVEVSAEDYIPVQLTVNVLAGQLRRQRIELVQAVAPSPPPRVEPEPETSEPRHTPSSNGEVPRPSPIAPPIPQPTPSSDSPALVGGLLLGAATVLALGGTLTAVGVRESAIARWNDDTMCPPEPRGRRVECPGLEPTFLTAGDFAVAGAVLVSALAVTTAVLLIVSIIEGDAADDHAARAAALRF